MLGSDWVSAAFAHIVYSVETGRTGMEKAWGMPIFDYLAQHPEDAPLFSEAMVGFHGAETSAVVRFEDDGTATVVKDGKIAGTFPLVNMLLVLGFDVYTQDPETTIKVGWDDWQGECWWEGNADQRISRRVNCFSHVAARAEIASAWAWAARDGWVSGRDTSGMSS